METALEKKRLRAIMKERLALLSQREIEEQSRMASMRVTELSEFKAAGVILSYMAMPKECSPALIAEAARAMNKSVAFPKCVQGGRLELYIPGKDGFARGAYGIMEPVPDRCTMIAPDEVQLIIVPGVAFDAACNRLGHGAGYYDRLLMSSSAVKVGLALEQQLVNYVPVGEHDQPLDCVVWRNGINCK